MTACSLDLSLSDIATVDVIDDGTSVHLVVAGEIDASSAPALRAQLDAALDAGPAEIVLDLGGVTFLDSAGLSVLAGTHRRAGARDVRLRVLASGRAVMRPMQITGLWDLLGAEQIASGAGPAS